MQIHWSWDALSAFALAWAPRVGGALMVLLGFWILASIVDALVHRFLRKRISSEHADLVELTAQVVRVALWVFGLVSALGTLGINTSALVTGLGLTGFALGFALKDALSNVLAGAMILFYRPFHRGARIAVSGFEGTVEQIDLRYTTLSGEGKRFLIPNSSLLTNAITVLSSDASDTGTAANTSDLASPSPAL